MPIMSEVVTQRKQQGGSWLLSGHESLRQPVQILLSILVSYCEHFMS
ncbi:hypothetical protein ALP35_02884 [Pseudomonas savastanoi pv. glycinea]|nr:hypothetical protein ALP35_02884 [Pseudomonas savastanoi pv. glycinea]